MTNRRRFLGSLAAAGMAGLTGSESSRATGALPPPSQSQIDHIVVVTMENRSFDHFLGWLPGADSRQPGLTYLDKNGVTHPTMELAPDYTGCPHPDPDHSYTQSRVAYDNGAMDGFLRAGSNDTYAIGYYGEGELPFLTALAQNYAVCDGYFASILGPTFPNRLFLWAAQTDRLDDSVSLTNLPTIFDRLAAKGVSHRYFFNNLPFLAMWGLKYIFSTGSLAEFLQRAGAGTLPAVSFVDPIFTVLDDGTGNDDHPHADIRNGDAFLATIFQAVTSGRAWQHTVLIINFDEWGGFFEHVPPPRAAAPNSVDSDLVNGKALLGFRVPTIVVSPFTRNTSGTPLVNHTVFDHTSVLQLIEWRWGLEPLTARDGSSDVGNLATLMNFGAPNDSVPAVPLPGPVAAPPCFENLLGPGGLGVLSTSAPRRSTGAVLASSPGAAQWARAGKLPLR